MDQIFQFLKIPLEMATKGEPLVVAFLFCMVMLIGFWLGSGMRFVHKKWTAAKRREITPIASEELLK